MSLHVVVLVHARSGVPGLGSAGRLGHDDLVDLEDVGGGLGGVLDAPQLDPVGVEDVLLQAVQNGAVLDIEAGAVLAGGVGGQQGADT